MRMVTQEQTKGVMWGVFGLLLFHVLITCLTDFGGIDLLLFTAIMSSALISIVRISDPERLPISILSNNKFLRGTFVFLIVFVIVHAVFLFWKIIFTG